MTQPPIPSDDPFHRTLQAAVVALEDALLELIIQLNKTLQASHRVRTLTDDHDDLS